MRFDLLSNGHWAVRIALAIAVLSMIASLHAELTARGDLDPSARRSSAISQTLAGWR